MGVSRETIAAIATAPGRSALGVIRVSGPDSVRICSCCLHSPSRFVGSANRVVGVYELRDPVTAQFVDQVCATKFQKPRSYTGEDMVEISCHGGEAIPPMVLDSVIRAGARLAEPGEFTRRAVECGKMTPSAAEATGALIDSSTQWQHDSAASLFHGEAHVRVGKLEQRVLTLAAGLEAGLETEVEGIGDLGKARKELSEISEVLEEQLRIWDRRRVGTTVVLAGVANAGKSTLFNGVIGSARALVAMDAGTTRDYIAERVSLGAHHVRLIDTAGFGVPDSGTAKEAIERTWEQITRADLVVWVSPLDVPIDDTDEMRLWREIETPRLAAVLSKADREQNHARRLAASKLGIQTIAANLLEAADLATVRAWLTEQVSRVAGPADASSFVVTERQAQVVRMAVDEARRVLYDGNVGMDLFACGTGRILALLQDLYLRNSTPDTLQEMLSRFCVGK